MGASHCRLFTTVRQEMIVLPLPAFGNRLAVGGRSRPPPARESQKERDYRSARVKSEKTKPSRSTLWPTTTGIGWLNMGPADTQV